MNGRTFDYPATYELPCVWPRDGRLVVIDALDRSTWAGIVTEESVILRLARIQRYNGAMRSMGLRGFDVLTHSVFCYWSASGHNQHTQFACLVHDWAESMIGDIATPLKDARLRLCERKILSQMASYFLWPDEVLRLLLDPKSVVYEIDKRDLAEELNSTWRKVARPRNVFRKYTFLLDAITQHHQTPPPRPGQA